MLQFNSRKFLIGYLILLSSAFVPTHALATGESVTIDSFDTMACTAGGPGAGIVIHVNGTDAVDIRFSIENLSKTTSGGFTTSIFPSGTYQFTVSIPVGTVIGDSMNLTIDLLDQGSAVVATDSLAYRCGVVANVPTLSEWGLVFLVLMFAGLAWRRFGVTGA